MAPKLVLYGRDTGGAGWGQAGACAVPHAPPPRPHATRTDRCPPPPPIYTHTPCPTRLPRISTQRCTHANSGLLQREGGLQSSSVTPRRSEGRQRPALSAGRAAGGGSPAGAALASLASPPLALAAAFDCGRRAGGCATPAAAAAAAGGGSTRGLARGWCWCCRGRACIRLRGGGAGPAAARWAGTPACRCLLLVCWWCSGGRRLAAGLAPCSRALAAAAAAAAAALPPLLLAGGGRCCFLCCCFCCRLLGLSSDGLLVLLPAGGGGCLRLSAHGLHVLLRGRGRERRRWAMSSQPGGDGGGRAGCCGAVVVSWPLRDSCRRCADVGRVQGRRTVLRRVWTGAGSAAAVGTDTGTPLPSRLTCNTCASCVSTPKVPMWSWISRWGSGWLSDRRTRVRPSVQGSQASWPAMRGGRATGGVHRVGRRGEQRRLQACLLLRLLWPPSRQLPALAGRRPLPAALARCACRPQPPPRPPETCQLAAPTSQGHAPLGFKLQKPVLLLSGPLEQECDLHDGQPLCKHRSRGQGAHTQRQRRPTG